MLPMVFMVLAGANPAAALDPHRAVSQYIQSVWNTDAGLPQTSVYSIAQTTDGYLWAGTELGLARFDGVHFTVYNQHNTSALPANYIHRLLGTRDGSLWIGTDSGLTRLKDGVWTTWTDKQGLSGTDIRALVEGPDGSLWVGTDHGLDRLQNGKIVVYSSREGLPGDTVNALQFDAGGRLWIATNSGLASYDGRQFTPYTHSNGLPNNTLLALAIAPDGAVWVGFAQGQLARVVNGVVSIQPAALPMSDIESLLFDRDSNLWIGFQSHGLARMRDGVVDLYNAQNGLPGEIVETLFQDTENNLWVGLFDGGLVQLRDGSFSTYGKPEGLSTNTGWCGLQARDGTIWMATSTGELNHVFAPGKVRVYTSHDGLSGEVIHSIIEARDGSIWLGQRHGTLTHYYQGRFTTYRYPAARNASINALLEDRAGDLFIGTYGAGSARFKDGNFDPVLNSGNISAIAEAPDGSLWFATDGTGVIELKNGQATHFNTASGLLDDHASALHIDRDGVVWVGAISGGLNRIQNGHVTSYSQEQGLFDSTVGNILEDNLGNLWMGSDNGIFRVSKRELTDFAEGRIHAIHCISYGTADGLRSRETMQGGTGTASKGPDGRLWFATMGGLSVTDPRRDLDIKPPPPVRIVGVSFDSVSRVPADGLRLGPGSGRLEIQFTSPVLVVPSRVRFRSRLLGFDRDWSAPSVSRTADYTNLPPGHYRFEAQVQGSGGAYSANIAALEFDVLPRWYRTNLAYLAYVLGAILLTWAIVDLRTRNLLRHRKRLEQLVAERTRELEIEKSDLLNARQALLFQATHDSLTTLWNRGAILEHLTRELERAQREDAVLTIVLADLDHFKLINDTFGHICGDIVLRDAAERFLASTRGYDLVGRYGGEEFLILVPGCNAILNPGRVRELADAISGRPFQTPQETVHLTCSFGVVSLQPGTAPLKIEEIIRRADAALYRAKSMGRNRIEYDQDGQLQPSRA
jgi:diguanylate cyclase (GGDEF)-like protein